MNVKISVIVPICNIEKYLPQCIDSIINQTYKNFELILVNDGSTDSSGSICDDCSKKDRRIQCIHKSNGGLVSARKAGVDAAEGEYILFIDGDDWVDYDEIEKLIQILVQNDYPDMIAFGLVEEYVANSIIRKNSVDEGLYVGEKLLELKQKVLATDVFFEWKVLPNLCNKLIKKRLLEHNIYNIPNTVSYGEDVVCSFPCILEASSIYIYNDTPYHYRQREGSIVKARCELPQNSFCEVYDILHNIFGGMEENSQDLKMYLFFILMLKGYGYLLSDELPLFPFADIEKFSKIVIYCAGGFGKVLHEYACNSTEYTVVGWTDTMAEQYQTQGFNVQAVEEILDVEFDYIIIAILKESTAEQIARSLYERGVPMQKIKYIKKEMLEKMELPEWLIG